MEVYVLNVEVDSFVYAVLKLWMFFLSYSLNGSVTGVGMGYFSKGRVSP